MFLSFEDRPSDSPLIERVWRSRSAAEGRFHSIAESNLEIVVATVAGRTSVILRGPVTQPSLVDCPRDGEWFAIRFRLGTHFPNVPTAHLMNGGNLVLGEADGESFHLGGSAWETPDFGNAEVFVSRLAREGIIALDETVANAVDGDSQALSRRSVQRRFLRSLGMSFSRYRQIERARYAVRMLRAGASVFDVVHDAGYFDQPHLIHSLRQQIGLTPTKLLRPETQLSFLYNTGSPSRC